MALQHFGEALGIGLAPEMAGVAEAIGLVVVVVGGGEILYAVFDGGVGDAVPMFDAGGAEMNVVPRVGLFHAGVMRDAQTELVRLRFHGLHGVAVDAQNLDAVGAGLLQLAHVGHGLLGRARAAEHGVNENARRGDLAVGTLTAEFERAPGVAADVANGSDAAGQPDIQFVLDGLRLAAALLLQMGVGVNQAWENVLAGGVDDGVGGWHAACISTAERNRI